jgi:hypothetical protein
LHPAGASSQAMGSFSVNLSGYTVIATKPTPTFSFGKVGRNPIVFERKHNSCPCLGFSSSFRASRMTSCLSSHDMGSGAHRMLVNSCDGIGGSLSSSGAKTSSSPVGLGSWPKVTPPSSLLLNFLYFLIVPNSGLLILFFLLFGAVLIEKILRTNADVGKIYVMVKANDEEAALKRLQTEVCIFFWLCSSAKQIFCSQRCPYFLVSICR